MRVEGRGFKDLGKCEPHLVGQRRQMRRGDLMVGVLDQVQIFDQQIALPRPIPEQGGDLFAWPGG